MPIDLETLAKLMRPWAWGVNSEHFRKQREEARRHARELRDRLTAEGYEIRETQPELFDPCPFV